MPQSLARTDLGIPLSCTRPGPHTQRGAGGVRQRESGLHRGGLPHGQPHALGDGGLRRIRTLPDLGAAAGRHHLGQAARCLPRAEKDAHTGTGRAVQRASACGDGLGVVRGVQRAGPPTGFDHAGNPCKGCDNAFPLQESGPCRCRSWGSSESVRPLARIAAARSAFPDV
jgi:hypothetical protein